eukprot:CAMPEP_0167751668 /NCGR_PEP_ID=MMETSP0110_2-20121227/6710_1 /TAXON_ID=629695 /ORGANISM="Gymnochlora sp., Strain CCMP2014" /LENGTH=518 /DNA_ID=CAMNT_0007637197 /DNA_START=21 /DNA_END=1577 /DNA_ORIENTATION=+
MGARTHQRLTATGFLVFGALLFVASVLSVSGRTSSHQLQAAINARVVRGPSLQGLGCRRAGLNSLQLNRMAQQFRAPRYSGFGIRAEGEDASEVVAEATESVSEAVQEAEAEPQLLLNDLEIGAVYQGKVKGVVSFGAFVDIGAEKDGLLHVSDLGETGYIADAGKFLKVGQDVEVRVKSVDPVNSKLSLEANKEARTKLSDLQVGSMIEGKVRNVAPFGAFVDIGAEKDGLLHISQLEGYVEDINKVLSEGQELTVRLAGVDISNGKITLSMREEGAPQRRTRQKQDLSKYQNTKFADKYEGKVVGVEAYGAFVELEDGTRGLLPISYMVDGRLEKVEDLMNVGDTISVSVLQANDDSGKISFTLIEPREQQIDYSDEDIEKEGSSSPGRVKRERPARPGDRQSFYEEMLGSYNPGKVVLQSTTSYDESPYLGTLGGAFAKAGIKMSDKAKSVLRERDNEKFSQLYSTRQMIQKAIENQSEEEAAAAVAAAAEAEAESKEGGEEASVSEGEPEAVAA